MASSRLAGTPDSLAAALNVAIRRPDAPDADPRAGALCGAAAAAPLSAAVTASAVAAVPAAASMRLRLPPIGNLRGIGSPTFRLAKTDLGDNQT